MKEGGERGRGRGVHCANISCLLPLSTLRIQRLLVLLVLSFGCVEAGGSKVEEETG